MFAPFCVFEIQNTDKKMKKIDEEEEETEKIEAKHRNFYLRLAFRNNLTEELYRLDQIAEISSISEHSRNQAKEEEWFERIHRYSKQKSLPLLLPRKSMIKSTIDQEYQARKLSYLERLDYPTFIWLGYEPLEDEAIDKSYERGI